MLRRGFVARLFRSVVVASLTWIGCISEEPDTPPPPPSGQDAPPEPPPLANPVLTDVFMSVSSAINMPNGMGVGISAAVSCRPGTPITGDRIYSDAERTVYATIEPGGEGDPFTIVSETGSCVVRPDGWARLQVINERKHDCANLPHRFCLPGVRPRLVAGARHLGRGSCIMDSSPRHADRACRLVRRPRALPTVEGSFA